jgi:chromate transport protein ChrA
MDLLLGLIAVGIAIVSYGLYFKDIFARRTKPHGFSWFIWAILNAFICYEQIIHGGGPGAWVTGVAAFADTLIFLAAFRYGERNITKTDWVCMVLALLALGIWVINSDVVMSVILACSVFVIGFVPTLRKSLRRAHEETAITFALNGLKFLISLFALATFTVTTALYPAVLFVVNTTFAVYLYTQRRSHSLAKRRRY